jgi:ADP-ribose pyrophosphatase
VFESDKMDLFLPKPFASPVSLELLTGRSPAGNAIADAVLEDHVLTRDASGAALCLVPQEGALTEGVLLRDMMAADMEPLSFVMAAFHAEAATVVIAAAGRPRQAIAFLQAPSQAAAQTVDPANWTPEHQAVFHEVIRELLDYRPNRAPEELPGLLHGIGFRAIARVRGARTVTPTRLRGWAPAPDDIDVISHRVEYARYFAVEEQVCRHRRFDGTLSGRMERTVLASGDAVTVLPFDPVAGKVLVIEQFRPAPLARRDPNPWLIEPIAGRCDKLETAEATVRREAREEAGLELGRLVKLPGYYSSPGISAEYITSFIAEADLSRAVVGTHGLEAEGEDIRPIIMTVEEAMAALESGEINVGPLVLSVLWLYRNRVRIAHDWSAEPAA